MSTDENASTTKAVGSAIRLARSRQGISQEALADLSALDRTYISGVERGARNPTVRSIWRIANALGVKPSDLFRDAEEILVGHGGHDAV